MEVVRSGLTHRDAKIGTVALTACILSAVLLGAIILIAALDLAVIGGITVGVVATVLAYEACKRFR